MRDLRIRSSVRSTPVPYGSRAFVFLNVYDDLCKVIIAPYMEYAVRRFNDFLSEQGLDKKGWRVVPYSDDFELICEGDVLPKR